LPSTQIISQRDVAIFTGLLALASFDRDELQEKVAVNVYVARRREAHLLSCRSSSPHPPPPPSDVSHFIHSEFKPFLDLAPQVRQLIKSFQESRYAESLALLDNLKVGQGQRLCNF
jgi:hypothetical protein